MLTLDKFEEASEKVKEVTLETKLVYSDYLSELTGNKVYLKPENMQFTGAYKVRGAYIRSAPCRRRNGKEDDHCICRKSCAGSCLCGKVLWCKGCHCHADHNAAQ